jgi:hypothetical protein
MLTLDDAAEHRRRLEGRVRTLAHVPAPTWDEVQQRAATYEPWDANCLRVGADGPVDQVARAILSQLSNR